MARPEQLPEQLEQIRQRLFYGLSTYAKNVPDFYVSERFETFALKQGRAFLAQLGLDKPVWIRYLYWLIGSDWQASNKVGLPLKRIVTPRGFVEWWAVQNDGRLVRWHLEGDDLMALQREPDGQTTSK